MAIEISNIIAAQCTIAFDGATPFFVYNNGFRLLKRPPLPWSQTGYVMVYPELLDTSGKSSLSLQAFAQTDLSIPNVFPEIQTWFSGGVDAEGFFAFIKLTQGVVLVDAPFTIIQYNAPQLG